MNLVLDIARGVAAIAVFLFHIRDGFQESIPGFATVFSFGHLGVPLFFVVSGYVISASAESLIRKNERAALFLKRRLLRIFPPFWISILVVIAIPYLMALISILKTGSYVSPQPRYAALSSGDWIQLASLLKVFTAQDARLDRLFDQVNAVYWTLAIELQFYLCVYVALVFRKYYWWIIVTVTAISIILLRFSFPLNPGLFIHYWPMFAIGIFLFCLVSGGWQITAKGIAVPAIGFIGGLVLYLAYRGTLTENLEIIFPSAGLGFALICSLMLWLCQPFESILELWLKGENSTLRWLIKLTAFVGVMSYSIYLFHLAILPLVSMVVRQVVPVSNGFNPILVFFGTLVFCPVFYRYAEKPFISVRLKKMNEQVLVGKVEAVRD